MSLGPVMISLRGPALEADEREWLASPAVGGVILFARNFESLEQLEALVDDVHGVRHPPLLVAVDHEGGRVQRFKAPFTIVPPARSIGHLYDRDAEAGEAAARAVGWLVAAELRAVGIDLAFAPVVDVDRSLSEVIGDRALHGDAQVVARLACALVAGMDEAGMVATAKHFPTHAGAVADSHTEAAMDRRAYEALEADLVPYRALIRAGLHSIMLAHVSFPELDPRPASLSSWWIREQLRGALGFSGAVISDDMTMAGAAFGGSVPERVVAALEAGCDLVLVCNAPDEIPGVLAALGTYEDPAAQLRLMRLRGFRRRDWDELRASADYERRRRLVAEIDARPALSLEG